MKLSLIAACDRNRAIGKGNSLPWSLPDDLKHFRATTSGKPVIMGRKTYESIGRPLPNRLNIVITRQAGFRAAEGVLVTGSLDEAIGAASNVPGVQEVFVIGGGEIYRLALPRADRLYLTLVDAAIEADAWFPSWEGQEFREVSRTVHPVDEKHAYAFSFVVLER